MLNLLRCVGKEDGGCGVAGTHLGLRPLQCWEERGVEKCRLVEPQAGSHITRHAKVGILAWERERGSVEICGGQAHLVHRGADGIPNLVNSTGDKTVDVLVLPENLWEGGAECWSCLHCRERHFTYRKGMRVELGAVGDTCTLHCSEGK